MLRVRPTIAEIDLDRLRGNLAALRRVVGPKVAVMAAVKGDAYGHGAVPCAQALAAAGVDSFGVALVEEGALLREAGIRTPILCLEGVAIHGAAEALRLDLTPMLFDLDSAAALDEEARRRGRRAPVHLKVDTGMGRLGVPIGEWGGFLDRLANFAHLEVEGIATHFAEAEADETFTLEQGRRFQAAVAAARQRAWEPRFLHTANSAAALAFPSLRFNMIRPGLALYGIAPRPDLDPGLAPVMQVRTRVLYVKNIPAGFGVSYGRRWVAPRPTRLATLPVGYADGYARALSNRAMARIGGRLCPVRGSVCMDMVMVDVTEVDPPVRPGDEAELMGDHVRAEELAGWAGTIPYEVLTGFSFRVPREYRGVAP